MVTASRTAGSIGGNSFEAGLKAFGEKALNYAHAINHRIVIDLSATLLNRSPYGDPNLWAPQSLPAPPYYKPGSFIHNWQYGTGAAPSGVLYGPNASNAEAARRATIRRIASNVLTKAGDFTHYIVNNSPYALRLEYDNWSKQAPEGMVEITIIQFENIVKRAVEEVVK